jgi:hypothetical protein
MSGWQRIGLILVAWLVGLPTVQALAQGLPGDRTAEVQALIQAARSLKFSVPENRAFILEKQETAVAEVAVIFGYADNRSACQEIADILIASLRAGTFKCHPID